MKLLKPPLSLLLNLVLNAVNIELLLMHVIVMLYLLHKCMYFLLVHLLLLYNLFVKLTHLLLSFFIIIIAGTYKMVSGGTNNVMLEAGKLSLTSFPRRVVVLLRG